MKQRLIILMLGMIFLTTACEKKHDTNKEEEIKKLQAVTGQGDFPRLNLAPSHEES